MSDGIEVTIPAEYIANVLRHWDSLDWDDLDTRYIRPAIETLRASYEWAMAVEVDG